MDGNCNNESPCKDLLINQTKLEQIEKDIIELKFQISKNVGRDEIDKQVEYVQKEIKSLRDISEKHSEDNLNIQKILASLETFTKSLQESIKSNQRATEQLMEKIDRVYDLMLVFKKSNEGDDRNVPSTEIKIVNDSNNKTEAEHSNTQESSGITLFKILEFLKVWGWIIFILVYILSYLITGKLPVITS